MSELSERVGRHIRRRRMELGLNQRQLADRVVDQNPEKNAAVSNQTVSNWERGVNEPGAYYKSALAVALGVDVSYFVAEEPRGETPSPFPITNGDADAIADRLDAIEQSLAEGRRERQQQAERIEGLLQRQDAILANIEAAITREDVAAARRDEESARLLAEAVQQAIRALEGDTRKTG